MGQLESEKLMKTLGINLDLDVVRYFREMGQKYGIPYQRLINLCLNQAMDSGWSINPGPKVPSLDEGIRAEDC